MLILSGKVPNGHTYTDYEFTDVETGVVLVHYLKVNTMGHAWSGGSTAGSYTDPKGAQFSNDLAKFTRARCQSLYGKLVLAV